MRPFPIFTVLLILVITLAVFVPSFPAIIEAAAGGLGIAPDQMLAAFVVVMLIAAILLSVLTVREIFGLVRCQIAGGKRAGRT